MSLQKSVKKVGNMLTKATATNQAISAQSFLTQHFKKATPLSANVLKTRVRPLVRVSYDYTEKNGNHIYNLKLQADTDAPPPTNFVAVVDVSSSMNSVSTRHGEGSAYSKFDLVRHSLVTIASCCRPEDKFGLYLFSDGVQECFSPVNMSADNKRAVLNQINSIQACGNTNLFSGLKFGLGATHKLSDSENNFMVVLTDGEPNIEPNEGTEKAYKAKIIENGNNACISTFGYGYSINSELLSNIAEIGGGEFAHIPDGTMCMTVFNNYLANCFATSVTKVTAKVLEGNPVFMGRNILNDHYDFGALKTGIVKNIVFSTTSPLVKLDINGEQYTLTPVHSRMQENMRNLEYQLIKQKLFSIITNGLSMSTPTKLVHEIDSLCDVIEESIEKAVTTEEKKRLQRLLINIKNADIHKGQIYKAFSNFDWFNTWGTHYFRYFLSAHREHSKLNFKDESFLEFESDMTRALFSEIEEIFRSIPIPRPSLDPRANFTSSSFQNNFNSANTLCFDGEGMVATIHQNCLSCHCLLNCEEHDSSRKWKKVKDINVGDFLVSGFGKFDVVELVVRTVANPDGEMLCKINGMYITPYHPIFYKGAWRFPCDIVTPEKVKVDYLYSFVTEKIREPYNNANRMKVNGINVATLAHNIYGNPVIEHPFFGTPKIIEFMRRTWPTEYSRGYITINDEGRKLVAKEKERVVSEALEKRRTYLRLI